MSRNVGGAATVADREVSDGGDHLAGISDVDSHEMYPSPLWSSTFGEVGEQMAELFAPLLSAAAENTVALPDLNVDDQPINRKTVWNTKGPAAPSAFDLTRRPAVLDEMGIARQLVFPSFGFVGFFLGEWARMMPSIEAATAHLGGDPVKIGQAVSAAHNAWCLDTVRALEDDRVRPVATIWEDSVEAMIAAAGTLIDGGIRCVMLESGTPPAGVSPGDRQLDPFWKEMEQSDTAVVLHIGTEQRFLNSTAWSAGVPEFVSGVGKSFEFPAEPLACATVIGHAPETFLSAMVLSGVFERFPRLRFGVIESGAHWVGHLAEKLDLWAEQYARRLSGTLSRRLSEYLASNVRVTPFVFEPTATYIERFPALVDVFAYSSDFPHREGGRESKRTHYDEVARLGAEVVHKYFVVNGSLLLPD